MRRASLRESRDIGVPLLLLLPSADKWDAMKDKARVFNCNEGM